MAAADKESSKKRVGDGSPGPGRTKGVPNKVTADVKAMILEALEGAGGASYLLSQAHENPKAFMSLIGRVLPLQVNGPGPNGEHVFERIVREIVEPR